MITSPNFTQRPFFKKSILSLVIATVCCHAVAEETPPELIEVKVIGQAAGIDKALKRQRAADGILSSLSSDGIGQFPDSNVSESLARIPGISIERDQGEGRFVRVRGLSPSLNSVTFNGSKITAPGDDGRSVGLDVVPSDLVESLNVYKTWTPDKDADAIGGTIEVNTLSAFDRDGFYLTTGADMSYDDNTGEASPKLSLTTSKQFSAFGGENNLGVASAVSWQDRDFGSDNVETGGGWNFDDSVALMEEVEQRRYDINRERMGFGLNIDFRPDEDNEYYLRTLHSKRDDSETRQATITEFYTLDGMGEEASGVAEGGTAFASVERELKQRLEAQSITSMVLGAKNTVNVWTFDYAVGYSTATEEKPFHIDGGVFALDLDGSADVGFTNTREPRLVAPAAFYDASAFELDEIETLIVDLTDEESNVRFDISRELTLANNPSEFKFGAKMSTRSKESNEDVVVYGDYDDALLPLSSYSLGEIDYALGRFGPGINGSALLAVLDQAGDIEADLESSNVNDFEIDEDIQSAYVMLTTNIQDWRIIAGLRYEGTDISATGKTVDDATETVTATTVENDFDHILPALVAKYDLTEQSALRMAWTNSVVRPTFVELSPGTYIEDNEAERGNPLLDPWESSNLDFGYEYYFAEASAISAFVFYKDIENFVYEAVFENVDGFDELSTYANGETADLVGLEFSYSQKFATLPEPWNGLLVASNLTLTDSEADFGARKIQLPSQSDLVGNLSLGYENDWMSLRLSGNYKSEYLLEVGEEAVEDAYVDDSLHIDFTARFWVNENIQLSFDAVNLTDQEYYVYNNNPRFNTQYESYGPNYKIGIRYSNF